MRARGFTLIEMLVVVGIIFVLSAAAVLLAPPGEAQLAEREASRLAALLELALVEAHASGKAIAWQPTPRGYAFARRNEDGEWAPFASGVLRARTLPGETRLQAESVTLAPYGLGSPIEARIVGGGQQIILRGGVIGRISLERL